MGTRSFIAINLKDSFKGVYCHWDGYLEHVGRILAEHYADEAKLTELINHGDISSLDALIGSQHDFDDRSLGQTTFYGRDRGEKDVGARSRKTLRALMNCAARCGCEFFYLFADGAWKYAERGPQYFGGSDGSPFSKLKPLPKVIDDPGISESPATPAEQAATSPSSDGSLDDLTKNFTVITVAVPDDHFVSVLLAIAEMKFPLGQLVATTNAVATLDPADIREGLHRHACGDWGDICEEDRTLNDLSLTHGDRLLSVYGSGDKRFWIITESDRSVTTVLMPEDY